MPKPSSRSIVGRVVPVVAVLALLPAAAQASCFTMYDARNTAVYQSGTSPIDLRGSIAVQMARRFPARYLVIEDSANCVEIGMTPVSTSSSAAGRGARDPASLLRGTPDADRFDGPYLETSPAPQTASSYPAEYAPDPSNAGYGYGGVYDGYPTGIVRGATTGVGQSFAAGQSATSATSVGGTAGQAAAPAAPAALATGRGR